ncbi:hypothetical protein LXA43DRAFT_882314 [Ganoderma leucocontextum]|nr:hypothetical protein LXA43DRAFT_882314 [Ganoderma leucocontextum]
MYADLFLRFNVDRREKDLAGGAKLGEFFWDNMTELYQSLRIPCLPKAVDKWLSRGPFVVQWGLVGKLSTEVLDMIFEVLLDDMNQDLTDNFLDCIFFAICCKRLLSVGKRHILRALISQHARAADCRLVCLGEYAGADDQAPPGMLTDAELKEIATTPGPDEDEYESADDAIAARCFYTFALESYEPYYVAGRSLLDPLRDISEEIHNIRWDRGKTIGPPYSLDLDMIAALGGVDSYYPKPEYPEGPIVLCNMSKGEYVREDKLVVWEMGWRRVTLAQALLSRICYSWDPSISMWCGEEYIDKLVKGPWAGDRFRITIADEMPWLKGGKEWKDVTKDVNALLCHLLGREMAEEEVARDDEALGGRR